MIVTRPSRIEDVVTDSFAVDLRLIDAESSYIQSGHCHSRADLKLPAQQRARLRNACVFVPIRSYKTRRPILRAEQSSLDRVEGAPLRSPSIVAPSADAHREALAGVQRGEGPGYQHRLFRLDTTGCVAYLPVSPLCFDFVRGLDPPGLFCFDKPGEPRLCGACARCVTKMLET